MVVHDLTKGNLIENRHFKGGIELKEVKEWYSIICTHNSSFNHLPIERHLGYFHFLAVTKKAALNIHVQGFA